MGNNTFSSNNEGGVLKTLPCELSEDKLSLIRKFDKFAFVYDFVHEKIVRSRVHKADPRRHRQLIKEMLAQVRSSRILDLACGKGGAIQDIAADNDYTGLDLSYAMIKRAVTRGRKKSFKKVTFIQGDAENLLFEDSTFDFVFMDTALHMIREYQVVISEISRVLSRGGLFICSTPMVGISDTFDSTWKTICQKSQFHSFAEDTIRRSCSQNNMTYKRYASNGGVIYFQAQKGVELNRYAEKTYHLSNYNP